MTAHYSDWIADCKKHLEEAERSLAAGDHKSAAEAYDQLSRAWLRGAGMAATAAERKNRSEHSLKFRELALQVSRGQVPSGAKPGAARPDAAGASERKPRPGASATEAAAQTTMGQIRNILARDEIGQMIIALVDSFSQESAFTWDDIGGLDDLVRDLKQVLGYTMARQPEGVRREVSGDILLFGPPGTGKTILASALSNSITMGKGPRGKFFNVRTAGLKGHYQGNTEKSISLLYETARELAPSLVFIDEIDGLCTSRGGSQDSAARAILGVLLQELDGMASKGRGADTPFVLTVAATNMPWDLDYAILSRFGENRILVPAPSQEGRRQILEKLTLRQGYQLTDPAVLDWLSEDERTAGYSGRDLRSLAALAKRRMELDENPWLSNWNDLSEIASKALRHRPLARQDFERALKAVPPSITEEMNAHYLRWDEDPSYRPRQDN